jgi:hypothetical protein
MNYEMKKRAAAWIEFGHFWRAGALFESFFWFELV